MVVMKVSFVVLMWWWGGSGPGVGRRGGNSLYAAHAFGLARQFGTDESAQAQINASDAHPMPALPPRGSKARPSRQA
jgi:hypothetical protein